MKNRPWIWLILANVFIIVAITTLVVIAVRHTPAELPGVHEP